MQLFISDFDFINLSLVIGDSYGGVDLYEQQLASPHSRRPSQNDTNYAEISSRSTFRPIQGFDCGFGLARKLALFDRDKYLCIMLPTPCPLSPDHEGVSV